MATTTERLIGVAIIRDGAMIKSSLRSHWELRAQLNPYASDHARTVPGDVEGFTTSFGRFVQRREAKNVAIASGQVGPHWGEVKRELLSSDVRW